jgi:hypothetical protein
MAAGDGVGGRAGVISEAVARPDIIPPDEYVLAVRDQVLAQLLARASREVKHPLSATLMLWRDRKPVREFGERVSKGKGAVRPGEARVRFHETFIAGRLLFELEARFVPDARHRNFAGFEVIGDARATADGVLVAGFSNWTMHWGAEHWPGVFESEAERAARLDTPARWDVRETSLDVTDLQSLVAYLVRRYGLQGGLAATLDGVVQAGAGDVSACSSAGIAPLLNASPAVVREFAENITLPLSPYSISDGRWVAYFARPTRELLVVLLRERPADAELPDEWGWMCEATALAEGRIAEQMLLELRERLRALGCELMT